MHRKLVKDREVQKKQIVQQLDKRTEDSIKRQLRWRIDEMDGVIVMLCPEARPDGITQKIAVRDLEGI